MNKCMEMISRGQGEGDGDAERVVSDHRVRSKSKNLDIISTTHVSGKKNNTDVSQRKNASGLRSNLSRGCPGDFFLFIE